jgi:FAD/FMN-containing dehydrogenase
VARSAGVAAAALWTPAFKIATASAASTCAAPQAFPTGIPLYQQAYQNWAQQITVDDVWTCAPRTADDVVAAANWAFTHGYRLRARGMMHGWSPLTVTPGSACGGRVVLLDTTEHLTGLALASTEPAVLRAQTGATMDVALEFLEQHGLGVTACPAPGDITIGGALAIDAHGTAIPAIGEEPISGHTYGSLSNLILSLTAVVWSPKKHAYVLRRFERDEADAKAFLVHLGRTIVTEVELRVGANSNLRCQSYVDIPVSAMFAAPTAAAPAGGPSSYASYLEESGRVEAIWYPFTDNPWLKVWSVSPTQPAGSTTVSAPYNYVFSDRLPVQASELATEIINGQPELTPLYGQAQYDVTAAGLPATSTQDIWGPSKDLLLYIRPTTIRETANGYTVQCRRADVQRIVSEFASFFTAHVAAYQARGQYPVNMPVEIRVTGLDQPGDIGAATRSSPVLSALHPRADRPEWDTSVWIDVLTFPLTPYSVTFYRELEQWFFSNYNGHASVRPEWSKGWAYGPQAAWSDPTVLNRTIPTTYRKARQRDDDWDWALSTYDRYDPHRIFTNDFLDLLMPPPRAHTRR